MKNVPFPECGASLISLVVYRISAAVLILALWSFADSNSVPGIIISEIYRDPPGRETDAPGGKSHEFVELTNLGPVSISLDSLFITDGAEADSVVVASVPLAGHELCTYGTRVLAPGKCALILDPDYREAAISFPLQRLPIRPGTIIWFAGDSEIGNGLAGDDGLLLYKGTKTRIDSTLFFAGDGEIPSVPSSGKISLGSSMPPVPEGFSVIPVSLLKESPVFTVGADSLSPGFFEPLRGGWYLEYQFGILDPEAKVIPCVLKFFPVSDFSGEAIAWSLQSVMQSGMHEISRGTAPQPARLCSLTISIPLDSARFNFSLQQPGEPHVSWTIDISGVWTPQSPVIVNEIFPRATASEPEWFELVNISSMFLDIGNWMFGNAEDTAVLARHRTVLAPGEYVVITKDEALLRAAYPALKRIMQPPVWHTLNNYVDTLSIWDNRRNLKESVSYQSAGFEYWKSGSLERVSTQTGLPGHGGWAVAQAPTPGLPNGAALWRATELPLLNIGPVPFTPDNDGRDDFLAIRLTLGAGSTAEISIIGFDGRIIRRFSGPAQQLYMWDGRADDGTPAPVGPFFVHARVRSGAKSKTLRHKGVLWR